VPFSAAEVARERARPSLDPSAERAAILGERR
jgi:hypothetical protein